MSSPALGPMGSVVGPGGNRASVLKSTYLAQYKMRFQQASGTLAATSSLTQEVPPPSNQDHTPESGPPASKKKRKSRWD